MKIKKFLICMIIFLVFSSLRANPILLRFINELYFDSTGWVIELNPVTYFETLDSCYLTSLSDTAYFKNGISPDYDEFLLITNEGLQKPLFINPAGDIITLYLYNDSYPYPYYYPYYYDLKDSISFGNVTSAEIVAPSTGQSISLMNDYYYLDNTPTLGKENDFFNAMGQIDGHITDIENNPLENVEIHHSYSYGASLSTSDSLGNFSISKLAAKVHLYLTKEGYESFSRHIQVYPESTLTVHFQMSPLEDIADYDQYIIQNFQLYDNYPNPFNSTTFFKYQIPIDDWVDIDIYDIRGRLIENLYHGFQHIGEYTMMWNAVAIPSGTYIFQLKSSRITLRKKCTLIK